jgi:hypothetical protein
MDDYIGVCEHGQLRRQCEVCEKEEALSVAWSVLEGQRQQIADLTAKLAEADQEKADTVLRMSTWAANTLHTCHEGCDRPLCVANGEINHLRAEVADLKQVRVEIIGQRDAAEARLRELREWIATAHHLPLCKKWSYALDDQMQIVPALVHDRECTCGRDSALANSGEQ